VKVKYLNSANDRFIEFLVYMPPASWAVTDLTTGSAVLLGSQACMYFQHARSQWLFSNTCPSA